MRLPDRCLPLECWPYDALTELKASIEDAFARGRVKAGPDWLTALDWLDSVNAELSERAAFDLEAAIINESLGEVIG